MSKWEMVRLGDVADIVAGSTPKTSNKAYWNGTNCWVTPAELNENDYIISDTERKITDLAVKETGLKQLPKGTVLLSSRAPIGKVAITGRIMYSNQGFKNLICGEQLFNKYLYWYLKKKKDYLNSLGRGATFKEISKSIVQEINIPIPPYAVQKKIANTLDKTQEMINGRKKQLKALDKLIKAVFYHMFGDPVRNEKGWNIKFCREITAKIGSGATPKGGNKSYKESGISLIRSLNVHNGYFKREELAFIDEAQGDKLKNVCVEKSDVLLNITGASVARSCIVPNDVLPARVNQHVAIVRPNCLYINSIFLNYLFTNPHYQQKLLMIAKGNGATREALTKQQIESLEIILPPIDLQNKFAKIANNVEQQKTLIRKLITENEKLLKGLMSKFFD